MAERVAPLLPHPLHLSDFSDGFLKLLHPRSIVLYVVFLNFLHVMICLWAVHSLCVFPREITKEAKNGEQNGHEPKHGRGKEPWHHTVILGGKPDFRGNSRVYRDEAKPDDHAPRDSKKSIFGPDVGHERRFTEHSSQDGRVQRGTPYPVTCNLAVTLWEIPVPNQLGYEVSDKGVVEAIEDPREKGMHFEKHSLLTKLIELGISVKKAS